MKKSKRQASTWEAAAGADDRAQWLWSIYRNLGLAPTRPLAAEPLPASTRTSGVKARRR